MFAVSLEVPRLARRPLAIAACLGAAALIATFVAGSGFDYRPLGPTPPPAAAPADDPREQRRLRAELARLAPRGVYIVIDRANNRLSLRRGESTLLDAVCSTGSGIVLRQRDGARQWVFDTPTGVFHVQSKIADPVWRKPDWAFVEEGEPVPGNPGDRIERGSLGEYGLVLGDGYLIHGTLYERLLGRSVTHGCIRLGRDDLRTVFAAAPQGTPVYIF